MDPWSILWLIANTYFTFSLLRLVLLGIRCSCRRICSFAFPSTHPQTARQRPTNETSTIIEMATAPQEKREYC